MEKCIDIYFNDLNEDAQEHLLSEMHISSPSELNWDTDNIPLAQVVIDDNIENNESILINWIWMIIKININYIITQNMI